MFRELLASCATVTVEQATVLEAHYELLIRWNRVLNLTGINCLEEAVRRHYCEALFLAGYIPDVPGLRVMDVGSGAGFPGFPLGVVRPNCTVSLVESHSRKFVFLREASRHIGNIRVVNKRAEEFEEEFDWVISRAAGYEILAPVVKRTHARLALLTGAEAPPQSWGLEWDAIPVPGGQRRFLRVSRETAQSFT